jgi:xyloglucan-specific endo-beta-1,4-glucanase
MTVSLDDSRLFYESNGTDMRVFQVDADYTTFDVTWKWPTGPVTGDVHSYPHIKFQSNHLPVPLSDITSLPFRATWDMQMSSGPSGLANVKATANVAVDMFADADPGAAQNETKAGYEIMIWLGSFSAPQPLGYDANNPCLTATVGDISLYVSINPFSRDVANRYFSFPR